MATSLPSALPLTLLMVSSLLIYVPTNGCKVLCRQDQVEEIY
jgi:hypothetical protein